MAVGLPILVCSISLVVLYVLWQQAEQLTAQQINVASDLQSVETLALNSALLRQRQLRSIWATDEMRRVVHDLPSTEQQLAEGLAHYADKTVVQRREHLGGLNAEEIKDVEAIWPSAATADPAPAMRRQRTIVSVFTAKGRTARTDASTAEYEGDFAAVAQKTQSDGIINKLLADMRTVRKFYDEKLAATMTTDSAASAGATPRLALSSSKRLSGLMSKLSQSAVMLNETCAMSQLIADFRAQQAARLASLSQQMGTLNQMLSAALALSAFAIVAAFACLVVGYRKFFSAKLSLVLAQADDLLCSSDAMRRRSTNNNVADEFSFLASVLADVKTRLVAVANQRQAIIEMVAHDVRTPLSAAKMSIDLVERGAPPTLRAQLADCKARIVSTVKTVESMLTRLSNQKADGAPSPSRASAKTVAVSLNKSTLFQKFLILILLPVVLQISFLTWLFAQNGERVVLARAIHQEGQVIDRTTAVGITAGLTLCNATLYTLTGRAAFRERAETFIPQLRAAFADLRAITEAVGTSDAVKQKLDKDRDLFLEEARVALQADAEQARRATEEFAAKMNKDGSTLETVQQTLLARRSALEQRHIQQTELMRSVMLMTVVALAVHALLSLAMLLFIRRDVEKRLGALSENAKNIADPGVALKDVGGADELAHLNGAFKEAHSILASAHAERSRVVDEMSSEWRGPLLVAEKEIEACCAGDDVSAAAAKDLAAAQANIRHVCTLIADLMDAQRMELGALTLEISSVPVQRIVERSLDAVASLASAKTISVQATPVALEIDADEARMIQVLVNLLSNAIKFSPRGSTVTVYAERHGDGIRIAVRDSGPGLSDVDKQRIFDRFARGAQAEQQEGFGLGLTIASSIVEKHGGRLTVESSEGAGSTFCVILPCKNV